MGKGTIISYLGVGYYTLSLELEESRLSAALAILSPRIDALTIKIAGMADGNDKNFAIIQKASLVKRKSMIESALINPNINAWCADLTKTLTGSVGTIEIPGERGVVQVQPGYDGNAVYSIPRDAQLQKVIASTPCGTFYNWAMLPGWQKWKPTFRIGVLSNLDRDNDQCTVTLDAAASSAQSLDINQETVLTGVSIDYMSCNAVAFENDDRVLVQFDNQDFTTPRVIGFETNPKSCPDLRLIYGTPEEYLQIVYKAESPLFIVEAVTCTEGSGDIIHVDGDKLYGSFTMCWENLIYGADSGAEATIRSAIEEHYQRTYIHRIIYEATYPIDVESKIFTSPVEQPPCSDISAESLPPLREEWTKTVDALCLTAFLHYPGGVIWLGAKKWSVSATIFGEVVTWEGGSTRYPTNGYSRQVCINDLCIYGTDFIDTHIGFDCWRENNEYYVALMSDVEATFSLWKYNPVTNQMDLLEIRASTVRDDCYEEDDDPNEKVRLIGFGRESKDTYRTYWCRLGYDEGYVLEDPQTGEASEESPASPGIIRSAMWSPIERVVRFATEEESEESSYNDGPRSEIGEYYTYGYLHKFAAQPCGSAPWTSIYGVIDLYGAEIVTAGWPNGFDCYTSCWTIFWMTHHVITNYKNYTIDDIIYDKGTTHYKNRTRAKKKNQGPHGGGCSVGNPIGLTIGLESQHLCAPLGRYDYALNGWIWGLNTDIAYNYKSLEYYEESNFCNPEWDGDTACVPRCAEKVGECADDCYAYEIWSSWPECHCAVEDWIDHAEGTENLRPFIDTIFPYDHTWKAILLHGVGKTSAVDDTRVEHENMVVYQDNDDDSLWLHDGSSLIEIGEYDRAFFQ